MPRLSKRVVDATEPRSGKPIFVWDDQVPGFGLKVVPGGGKRYMVKYRAFDGGRQAPQRWITLGVHGAITCEQARDFARQVLAAVSRGEDPQGDKLARRHTVTMADVCERYEAEQLPLKKVSTGRDYRQRWQEVVVPQLGRTPVQEVSRSQIDRLHKRLRDTPYQANRVLALLSRLLNLAEAWGWRQQGTNLVAGTDLSAEELVRLGRTLDELVA